MSTYEGVPGIATYIGMRLTNRIQKSRARKVDRAVIGEKRVTAHAWIYSLTRLVLHLAAFSLLTLTGFTINMQAGLITGALCTLVLSHLFVPNAPSENANDQRFDR